MSGVTLVGFFADVRSVIIRKVKIQVSIDILLSIPLTKVLTLGKYFFLNSRKKTYICGSEI
jgi:hypothetical protein